MPRSVKGSILAPAPSPANYDGVRKFQTVIGDGVFLGSDTQLIAPVTVGAEPSSQPARR